MIGHDQVAAFPGRITVVSDLVPQAPEESHKPDESPEKRPDKPAGNSFAPPAVGHYDPDNGKQDQAAYQPAKTECGETEGCDEKPPRSIDSRRQHPVSSNILRPSELPCFAHGTLDLNMPQSGGLTRAERRRRGSKAARALLVDMLAELTGTSVLEWTVSPPLGGRPFIIRHPTEVQAPFVSLSHDGNTVACSASWAGPVGVDVQRDRAVERLRAIASFLSWPAYLVKSNDAQLLTRAWATWEACSKASGDSVLGPVPGFLNAMESLEGRASSTRCIAKRLVDGWLVAISVPPSPGT